MSVCGQETMQQTLQSFASGLDDSRLVSWSTGLKHMRLAHERTDRRERQVTYNVYASRASGRLMCEWGIGTLVHLCRRVSFCSSPPTSE